MNNCCTCWFFTHVLTKCTVQEEKSPVKNSRQAALRGGIEFGVKGLTVGGLLYFFQFLVSFFATDYCTAFLFQIPNSDCVNLDCMSTNKLGMMDLTVKTLIP
jgi:hypothetical protein